MDIHNTTEIFELFSLATRSASANGTGVDIKDYVGTLTVWLDCRTGTGTLDLTLEDSADNSSFAALNARAYSPDGAAFIQVGDGVTSVQRIGIVANACRRYLRAVATMGTTPSKTFSVRAIGAKQIR